MKTMSQRQGRCTTESALSQGIIVLLWFRPTFTVNDTRIPFAKEEGRLQGDNDGWRQQEKAANCVIEDKHNSWINTNGNVVLSCKVMKIYAQEATIQCDHWRGQWNVWKFKLVWTQVSLPHMPTSISIFASHPQHRTVLTSPPLPSRQARRGWRYRGFDIMMMFLQQQQHHRNLLL